MAALSYIFPQHEWSGEDRWVFASVPDSPAVFVNEIMSHLLNQHLSAKYYGVFLIIIQI